MPKDIDKEKKSGKAAATSALQFNRGEAGDRITKDILQVFAASEVSEKTALDDLLSNPNPREDVLDLPSCKQWVVRERKAALGENIHNNPNAAWWGQQFDAIPEGAREKLIAEYRKEAKKREEFKGKVFDHVNSTRLGSTIISEVQLDDEYRTALIASNCAWLMKKIKSTCLTGVGKVNSDDVLIKLGELRQDNNDLAVHITNFQQIQANLKAAGWSENNMNNVKTTEGDLIKSKLLNSLSYDKSDTLMVAEVALVRGNDTWTITQIIEKLLKADQEQQRENEKLKDKSKGGQRKANAAAKVENKDKDHKRDGAEKDQGKAKDHDRQGKRGQRGRGGGRGGRGNDRDDKRSGEDKRSDDRRGDDDDYRERNRDKRGRGSGRGGGRGDGHGGRGREGRGRGHNDRKRYERDDRDATSDDEQDRGSRRYGGNYSRHDRDRDGHGGILKRTRFDDNLPRSFMIVCTDCRRQDCECHKRKAYSAGSRGSDQDDDDDFDYDGSHEASYRRVRGVHRATTTGASCELANMIQFDTGADVAIVNREGQLKMRDSNKNLSVQGITGEYFTPQKSGTMGKNVEVMYDSKFNTSVAPAMALIEANPGSGVLLTAHGLQVVNPEGMRRIDGTLRKSDIDAAGIARKGGWYLCPSTVQRMAEGTPKQFKVRTYKSDPDQSDVIQHSPETQQVSVRAIRRRPSSSLQPTPTEFKMTPAQQKKASDAQKLREALHPSTVQLAHLLDNNHVDSLATSEDAANAVRAYGIDAARHAALITRPTPNMVSTEQRSERVGSLVHGDLHNIAGSQILSSTDHHSGYHHQTDVGEQKTKKDVEKAVMNLKAEYSSRKHSLDAIQFDSESVLQSLKAPKMQGIAFSHTPPGQHEQFEESQTRVIAAKMRMLANSMDYVYDHKQHHKLKIAIWKAASAIENVLPTSRTGPTLTPYTLFEKEKIKLKPDDLPPIGTIAFFRDLNNTDSRDNLRVRAGIIVGYDWKMPGWFMVYDPETKQKPERKHLRNNLDILDYDAAMRLVDQWPGFRRRANFNRTPQLATPVAQDANPQVKEVVQALADPEVVAEEAPENAAVQALLGLQHKPSPIGWKPVLHRKPGVEAAAQEGATQEGAPQVQEGGESQSSSSGAAAVSTPPRENTKPITPNKPIPNPNPSQSASVSSTAPQEGESPVNINADLSQEQLHQARVAFASMGDVESAERLRSLVAKLEFLMSKRAVNAAKKGGNSGTRTFKQYEKNNPDALEDAVRKEIEGLIYNSLGRAIPQHTLSLKEMQEVVMTMLLLKEKMLPSGEFEKLKARLVALGNHMKEGTYGDTYSPTIGHATVMIILSIAAHDDAELEVTDVPSAFVHTPREKDADPVRIRLTGKAAEMWCQIRPQDRAMLTKNGHLILELDHYLYGMKDAPAAFHVYLKKVLEDAGFEAIISDVCLIRKFSPKGYFLAGGHVDDLLSTYKGDPQLRREFRDALANAFGHGQPLASKIIDTDGNYVGLYIERDRKNRAIYISQPQMIEKMHDEYPDINWKRKVTTPSDAKLFDYDKTAGPEVNGEFVDGKQYRSKVMTGMYVATNTKPDVLKELGFLASIKDPTERAEAAVDRVLIYIYQTKEKRLRIQPEDFQLGGYGDAGFATHRDGYSQSGIVITIGKSPIFFKCGKQKRIVLSSTGAEYETLTELCKYLEWMNGLLEEIQLFQENPIPVYQDNKSTITLATGPGTFKRSKQDLLRMQYVKDLVKNGFIEIVWVSTKDMIADILTKVLVGAHFRSQREGLGVV